MQTLSRRDLILLILLTLCWGINWPIMKIGVQHFPPLTFRALCMAFSLPALWLAIRLQGGRLAWPRGEVRQIAALTLPNMLVWHVFVILGVKMLTSGRAAILGYTMPVWAALSGFLFFGDRPTRAAWVGLAFALSGALLLLTSEFAALAGNPGGSLMVLLGAVGWGYGTAMMARSRLSIPTTQLTFWMLLLTTLLMGALSLLFERNQWRMPTQREWAAILYNALIIFAFAHVVWFRLARSLPPIASSLSVMMIPVLGVLSGAWILGEDPHWQDFVAMALILAAMSSVLLKPRRPPIN